MSLNGNAETTHEPEAAPDPSRFRLLASALASRPVAVAVALSGEAAHTDGAVVFVAAGAPLEEQRRQVLVQAALLGAGSLAPEITRSLRGRPRVARRYLSLEGRRVLAGLARLVPGVAVLAPSGDDPPTAGPAESLDRAQGRGAVPEPPEWFGQIRPAKLASQPAGTGGAPTESDLKLEFRPTEIPEADDDEEHEDAGKILRLFQNPLTRSNALTNFLSNLLGMSRQAGEGAPGGEMSAGSMRAVDKVGPHARPLPVPIRITTDDSTGPATGVGGALYPEWDEHRSKYRSEWCRVIEVPLGPAPDPASGAVERDEVLHRRLARLGLGPMVQRRRPDGDDLDVDALIDLAIDLRAGHSPKEHVYLERRKLRRDLGVLILLDASGSATEMDPEGNSVHEHQRKAAATLVATMEELGDRVALYGFRSRGRGSVHMLALKTFSGRFGAGGPVSPTWSRPVTRAWGPPSATPASCSSTRPARPAGCSWCSPTASPTTTATRAPTVNPTPVGPWPRSGRTGWPACASRSAHPHRPRRWTGSSARRPTPEHPSSPN